MLLLITQTLHQQAQQHLTKATSDSPINKKPFTGFDSRQKHTPVKGFSIQINESSPSKKSQR